MTTWAVGLVVAVTAAFSVGEACAAREARTASERGRPSSPLKSFPDHGRVITEDGPDDVGIPALEASCCLASERTKVDHFMTRDACIGKHARGALVTGSTFVEVIARNGDEVSTGPGTA